MNIETKTAVPHGGKTSPMSVDNRSVRPGHEWWRGAVIYQIYIRSFQDSDGDGIGDLKGITSRLPHVASLGVDAIWITPFYPSPMNDFGYDVSDYRDVDPMFGTLEDFDELVSVAHEHGLRVLIDQVFSHTSDAHPWFEESRSSQSNPRSDWYVWAEPRPDGSPPSNWLSVFGGPSWEWDDQRQQYYLHNFLASQPDLNFHNPEVQDALLDVVRFWLERGVDGFRLDTINFYFHDPLLRDNPLIPDEDRNDSIAPSVNPYNCQDHLYDKNQPENLDFLARLRSLLDSYPGSTMMGEVGDAQRGLEILAEYTAGDERAHMCYAFEFLSGSRPNAARVREVVDRLSRIGPNSWPAWAFSNHDVERHASRWGLDPALSRLMIQLMVCLRGAVCLYQGEEVGLPEAEIGREDLRDPYGIRFWPDFRGRDGCRTPMVWSSSSRHCGFSDGDPWLPIPDGHRELSIERQDADPDSLLNAYREAILLRKGSPALRSGSLDNLQVAGDLLTFERGLDNETIFCAFNLGDSAVACPLPTGEWVGLNDTTASGLGGELPATIELDGAGCLIAARKEEPN